MKETPSEIALPAKDLDFGEVNKRTRGSLHWTDDRPSITWDGYGRNPRTLEWRVECDEKFQPTEGRTLFMWRGQTGGGGLESVGSVMGRDFLAFVYLNDDENLIRGEIITSDSISSFKGPIGMYNPVFLEAREITRKLLAKSSEK